MHLVPAPAVKLLRNLGIEREMSVVVFMKLLSPTFTVKETVDGTRKESKAKDLAARAVGMLEG